MLLTLFVAAVDIVALANLLPMKLRPKVADASKRNEIAGAARTVGEALVATRNQVAHAKGNYLPTGKEVGQELLPGFNRFVRAAAESAIRWSNRLLVYQRSLSTMPAAGETIPDG